LNKKYWEESLQQPLRRSGENNFTLESILPDPSTNPRADTADVDGSESGGFYKKMVDFLIGEYLNQKKEILELKNRHVELKVERVNLSAEWLKFKKERYESWKQLMERKGRQKEQLLTLNLQLQRERLEFMKEQLQIKKAHPRRKQT
jgi:hypothetical protein